MVADVKPLQELGEAADVNEAEVEASEDEGKVGAVGQAMDWKEKNIFGSFGTETLSCDTRKHRKSRRVCEPSLCALFGLASNLHLRALVN